MQDDEKSREQLMSELDRLRNRVAELENERLKRERAEERLRESEERYRSVFENELLGLCIFDLETLRILDANETHVKLYGYNRDALLGGMTAPDLSAEREASMASLRQIGADGAELVPLRYHKKKDGTVFPVEIYARPIVYNAQRAMFAMVRDITERKGVEEALLRSEAFERAKRAELTALVEAIPCPVWFSHDSECRVITGNRAANELLGLPEEGANLSAASQQECLDRYEVWRGETRIKPEEMPMQRAVATRQSILDDEVRIVRADGSTRWVYGNAVPLLDEAGSVYGCVGVSMDVTELKRIEDELREKSQHLQEVNAALKALLRQRDEDRREIEEKVMSNIKHLVLPHLESLSRSTLSDNQRTWLDMLQSNLNQITADFTRSLSLQFLNLTTAELRVAALVQDGKRTKEIAESLGISEKAVSFHRGRIRTKLDLKGKKGGLRYLLFQLTKY